MSKIKIDYALSVLDKEIKKEKKIKNKIDIFNLELVRISSDLLTAYNVMLIDNYDEKELQKVFIEIMRREYLNLYKKYCISEIRIK